MNESYPFLVTRRQISHYIDSRLPGVYYMVNSPASSESLGTIVRTGTSNYRWRDQVKQKVDATTNYVRRGIYHQAANLRCDAMFDWPAYKIRGFNRATFSQGHPTIDFTTSAADVDDLALTRIKRKLAISQGAFNSLIPLAELRDLRRTINSATTVSSKYLTEVLNRSKASSKTSSLVDYAADKWLTYSFGVAPLVSDIEDLANAIQKRLSNETHLLRLVGSAGRSWFTSGKNIHAGCYSADLFSSHYTKHTYKVRYTGGINLAISSANSYSIASQFGFVKENFVPTLYELVPYSWLVDYFSTTGEFLEDVFSAPSGNTTYLVKNTLYRYESDAHYYHSRWTSDWPYHKVLSQIEGNSVIRAFHFSRTKLSSLPHRSWRLRTVDEVGRNALSKLLNLAAVLKLRRRN